LEAISASCSSTPIAAARHRRRQARAETFFMMIVGVPQRLAMLVQRERRTGDASIARRGEAVSRRLPAKAGT